MDPLLIEFPELFESERLFIRAPRVGDGEELNAAVIESFAELKPWMPWAQTLPTLEESEITIRKSLARFTAREDLWLLCFDKETGRLVVASGLHRIDWDVPRFEIGYWCRTSSCGRGYATEAVRAIAGFAREKLAARRIEIRMDDRNARSWRVAERGGFALEVILKNERRALDGQLSHTRIYAQVF